MSLKENSPFFKVGFLLFIILIIMGVSLYKGKNVGLNLSPDSYIYLDTAKNIHYGKGLVHSFVLTSQLAQWRGDDFYIPVMYWAPGFPIYIWGIHRLLAPQSFSWAGAFGIAISFLFTLITIVFLLNFIYTFRVALWGISFFLLFYPVVYTYSWVWSDGVVIPYMLLSLWLISRKENTHCFRWIFLAGLCAGIAFSIRYIQGILLPFGLGMLLLLGLFAGEGLSIKTKGMRIILSGFVYILGWSCVAIPIFIRNIYATGRLLDGPRPASNITIFDNWRCAFLSFIEEFVSPEIIPSEIQPRLLLAFIFLCVLFLWIRRNHITVKDMFYHPLIIVLCMWCFTYLITISLYTSFFQVDLLGHRLLLPFYIPLIILLSVWCERIYPFPSWVMGICLVFVAVYFCYVYPYRSEYCLTTSTLTKENARGDWVCSNTQSGDWIIGDSTFDLALLCDTGRRSLCFVPGSTCDLPPSEEDIKMLFRKKATEGSRVFLVLRKGVPFEPVYYDQWVQYYGEAITALLFWGKYGDIVVRDVYEGKGFVSAEVLLEKSKN